MEIRVILPDGSEFPLFATVWEVNSFFRISPVQYDTTPNRNTMDHFLSEIYRKKVAPKERDILAPEEQTMKDFFSSNVWWMVNDNDTIDALLSEIDRISYMWIKEVDSTVCADLKDWIIQKALA